MAPTLAYWGIRGRAQPSRFMLHHAGVEFEDKYYTSMEEWAKDKFSIGLEFPNLPYLIDGDVRLTETSAIIRYLGRKYGLAGTNEEHYTRIDVAKSIVDEMMLANGKLCYSPNFETEKGPYLKSLDGGVQKLSTLIGTNSFIIGDKPYYVDFELYELLERLLALQPTCLDKYRNLKDFHKRVGNDLPGVKKYISSPSFQKIKASFNGPMAKFGGAK